MVCNNQSLQQWEHNRYPLVNVYITMENHNFSWENPLSLTIFNSYVSSPEGNSIDRSGFVCADNYYASDNAHLAIFA